MNQEKISTIKEMDTEINLTTIDRKHTEKEENLSEAETLEEKTTNSLPTIVEKIIHIKNRWLPQQQESKLFQTYPNMTQSKMYPWTQSDPINKFPGIGQ